MKGLILDSDTTLEKCCLLALATAEGWCCMVSYEVNHSRRQISFMFSFVPEFIAVTPYPLVPELHMEEIRILLQQDFVD